MATNIPGFRFVRCPKCHKILAEIADVPVYKCGECGTILRAKNRAAAGEEGTSSGSLGNSNSQNLSNSNSLSRESISLAKVSSSDLPVSNSTTVNNPHQTEVLDHRKGIEQRNSENRSPTDQLSPARDEIYVEGEREPEERNQGHSLDEKIEKFTNPSPKDGHSSNSNFSESEKAVKFKQGNSLDENFETCTNPNPNPNPKDCHSSNSNYSESEEDVKLATGRSHSYYGSSSSPDRSQQNRLKDKYLLLSKRTFRHKKVSDSVDLNRDKMVSKQRDTTFGSEDFHSVQNWIGSETDEEASKSLSKDLRLYQKEKSSTKLDFTEPGHMKILRKVDELREELSEFIARTVEGKGASGHINHRFSQIPISNQRQTQNKVLEKSQAKEKKASVLKSHFRPVFGGSPFVVCHNCFMLLQLPADFLVTQKRFHKLQCGSCSKILQFSFRPKDHKSPMTPVKDRAGIDPVSYSDDYGIPFPESYSSEPEPEPVLHVSRNSSYSNQGSDGQRVGDSRLHRLMGYSSASELLFRPRGVDDEYQSTEPDTPQFYKYELNENGGFTPNSMEIEEEEEVEEERLRNKRRGFHGLLKKGVRELSQGLESVKLKMHSNG